MDIVLKIKALKKKKNAIILAHYYQDEKIQSIADYVGDSLGLSQKAAKNNADIIVFAGVHFMAETAKILNPKKKVVLPDLKAGCSLADSCNYLDFKNFIDQNPNHVVITYINCSAEIKSLSDIVCTSSNALKIVESIPKEKPIIFAPDKNLGKYIIKKTGRNMKLWDGYCEVHEAFSLQKLEVLKKDNPNAIIIAHPESSSTILDLATFIGSTSEMIKYVINNPLEEYIVATEVGILYKMREQVPNAKLIPAPTFENNTCACSECRYMKMNTLEKLYYSLLNESPEIKVEKDIRIKALEPIERMLSYS
jgi:quinolinate synthase